MKIKEIRCQIIKVAILGLFSLLLVRCQQSCQQNDDVAAKRPRVKNTTEATANVEQVNPSNLQSSTSPASNTESSARQPVAKPVNCDNKCNTVYDQCMVDFRQFEDVEQICKGKQTTCMKSCSASAPQTKQQSAPQIKAKIADGVGKCDEKCFTAKDQCEAEFRQFPDVEKICSNKLTTCLGKCP